MKGVLTAKAVLLAGGIALACAASAGAGYVAGTTRVSASASAACAPAPAASSPRAVPPWGGPATLPTGRSW